MCAVSSNTESGIKASWNREGAFISIYKSTYKCLWNATMFGLDFKDLKNNWDQLAKIVSEKATWLQKAAKSSTKV